MLAPAPGTTCLVTSFSMKNAVKENLLFGADKLLKGERTMNSYHCPRIV